MHIGPSVESGSESAVQSRRRQGHDYLTRKISQLSKVVRGRYLSALTAENLDVLAAVASLRRQAASVSVAVLQALLRLVGMPHRLLPPLECGFLNCMPLASAAKASGPLPDPSPTFRSPSPSRPVNIHGVEVPFPLKHLHLLGHDDTCKVGLQGKGEHRTGNDCSITT